MPNYLSSVLLGLNYTYFRLSLTLIYIFPLVHQQVGTVAAAGWEGGWKSPLLLPTPARLNPRSQGGNLLTSSQTHWYSWRPAALATLVKCVGPRVIPPDSNFALSPASRVTSVGLPDFPGSPVVRNPTCQCREHRFDPWSGKIPRVMEQLSLCATTAEPACCNYWSPGSLKPVLRSQRSHCNGKSKPPS